MASVRKRKWTTSRGEDRTAWCVDFSDTSGTRQRRHFATKREADAFRVEIEGQLKAGTFRPDAERMTVAETCEAYLAYCRGRMARGERMSQHHVKVLNGHITDYICASATQHGSENRPSRLTPFVEGIGELKLAQLTTGSINTFRDRLRSAGVTVSTTRKIVGTLQAVLEYARGQDWLAVNPARGLKVIGRRDEGARKIVPPSKANLRRLIGLADDAFKSRLIVAAATGVRAGELHALRWKHVDLLEQVLSVETRVDVYGSEDTTKSAAGIRDAPLGAQTVAVLKAWRLRSTFSREGDLVFPNRRGSYERHENMIKRSYRPLFARAGVPYFPWHGLRHFAVSCWIEAGLSPKTVQTFAGHSSLQVTMDRYGHLLPSEDHKHAMSKIVGELIGTLDP